MKIFIDDPVKRHSGEVEKELNENDRIRFELSGYTITVVMNTLSNCIEITKIATTLPTCQLKIKPVSSNKIEIK